jgi:hypothetical protein
VCVEGRKTGDNKSKEESILLHLGASDSRGPLTVLELAKAFNGEFDPGSELTLAECITHASRAGLPEITSTGSLAADE